MDATREAREQGVGDLGVNTVTVAPVTGGTAVVYNRLHVVELDLFKGVGMRCVMLWRGLAQGGGPSADVAAAGARCKPLQYEARWTRRGELLGVRVVLTICPCCVPQTTGDCGRAITLVLSCIVWSGTWPSCG